jgi:two-component system, NarL family, nitrate/nitrite response regulator NarL
MNEIRILMVDDHILFREGLSRLLEMAPGLRIVGQCSTTMETISALSKTPADVVLLDYDLGSERGSSLLAEIKSLQQDARVLMVTAGMSDAATLQVMKAGAAGIFHKHSSPDQLVAAIHQVTNNSVWLDSGAIQALIAARNVQTEHIEHTRPLTLRQREVLRGILDGLTNKEIAWNLKVSETSIKAVIQELFRKAGVRTRSQLVRIAIEKHTSDWLAPESGTPRSTDGTPDDH